MPEGIIKTVCLKLGGVYKDYPAEVGDTWYSSGVRDQDLGVIDYNGFTIYLPDESISGSNNFADGATVKIFLGFQEILDEKISIFPKSGFQKHFFSRKSRWGLINNFKIKGSKSVVRQIKQNTIIDVILANRQIYISTKTISNKLFVVLIPNEGVSTEHQLTELIDVMVELGKIITEFGKRGIK